MFVIAGIRAILVSRSLVGSCICSVQLVVMFGRGRFVPLEGVEIIARLVPRPIAETQENRLEMVTNQHMNRKSYVVHMLTRPVSTTGFMTAFSNNDIA